MNYTKYYINQLGILPEVVACIQSGHQEISEKFAEIESLSEYQQSKLLNIMAEHQISQRHFNHSTGYGYGDDGRDTLDKLFAQVFGGADALVRPQWVSGTHVLSDALFALLRPGDTFVSITGKPYDTLDEIIGSQDKANGSSLKDWGINYLQVNLTDEGNINLQQILSLLKNHNIKLVFIQRSRGYTWRTSISVKQIATAIEHIKHISPNTLIMVDNCYGEFTEALEPNHVGADLSVGSLIKNPGGGLAPTGAYAVGTREVIEALSYRLTSPGIGREVGSYPSSYTPFYQGLFLAPHVVSEAMKGAVLAAWVFETLGYPVLPRWDEVRSDIIQAIQFRSAEELVSFCQSIQASSPIDSHVVPYPWDMPGYSHPVIMAAGTFIQGASIELSADAPIRAPYTVYLQGGLTYAHVKLAIMKVLTRMINDGFIRRPNI